MKLAVFVLVGVVLLFGCEREGITIYAPAQLVKASIFIDGKLVGRFQEAQRLYRWTGWKNVREELSAPPRSETMAKVPPVAAGDHQLRIEKEGYAPIQKRFHYSKGRLRIEIGDEHLQRTNAMNDEENVLGDRLARGLFRSGCPSQSVVNRPECRTRLLQVDGET